MRRLLETKVNSRNSVIGVNIRVVPLVIYSGSFFQTGNYRANGPEDKKADENAFDHKYER